MTIIPLLCSLVLPVRYRINSPKVIHQIFETEVVIVNLETGNYYSISGSGIEAWRQVEAGFSAQEIADQLAAIGGPAEKLKTFVEELEREGLIVPHAEQVQPAPDAQPAMTSVSSPVLEKFTDMREMLLIDPIHELDESGWPRPAPLPEQK